MHVFALACISAPVTTVPTYIHLVRRCVNLNGAQASSFIFSFALWCVGPQTVNAWEREKRFGTGQCFGRPVQVVRVQSPLGFCSPTKGPWAPHGLKLARRPGRLPPRPNLKVAKRVTLLRCLVVVLCAPLPMNTRHSV